MFCAKFIKMVDKYNQSGEIKRHNRKPVAYKEQVKFMLDEIKKNKTIGTGFT